MKFRNLFAAAALLLAAFSVSSANATPVNLILDGNFAIPSGGGSFTTVNGGSSFGPWTVTGGSIDLIGGYWQSSVSGGGSVDLDGNSPGGIKQSVLLNPGTYRLSFDLSGNPDGGNSLKLMTAAVGGNTHGFNFNTNVGNTHGNMKYVLETFDFTVGGSSPQAFDVSFFSNSEGNSPFGAVVSNVSLVSTVPLPGALPLFGTALLGLVAFSFYRRQNAKI